MSERPPSKPSAVYANRMQRYPDDVWLIWSNKWGCWYRSNCQGYTDDIAQAGLYDRDVATKHYLPDEPRKHRDVEPFPLSSVQALLRLRIETARKELADLNALLERMTTLTTSTGEGDGR